LTADYHELTWDGTDIRAIRWPTRLFLSHHCAT
jgi:hypothetical protein